MTVYPYRLTFTPARNAAHIPFIVNGKPFSALAGVPVPSCVISSRSAGDMRFDPRRYGAVAPHGPVREAFFRLLGVNHDAVYSLNQVHSRDVFAVESGIAPGAFVREGDGMVSFDRQVFLAVTVADCLPVFLLDTGSGFFAALHSGWKGTGIVLKALSIMKDRGTRPEAVAAVLGPCIQSCCYQVDEERAAAFEAEFGAASPHVHAETVSGEDAYPLGPVTCQAPSVPAALSLRRYIALQAANARLLAAAGVRHVAYCEDCTFTGEQLGSYRREGQNYTRMVAMAGCFPAGYFPA
jgi:YfiH family protein